MNHAAPSAPIRCRLTLWLTLTALLAGCAAPGDQSTETVPAFDAEATLAEQREQAEPDTTPDQPVNAPSGLEDDLLDFSEPPATEQRFDVQARSVPLQRFFADLGRTQDVNILVDPSLSGTVSLELRSVTMVQVLNAVRDLYGFDYERTDYGYRILPNRIQTRLYQLDYLNVAREGRSDTTVSGGQITGQGGSSQSSSVATQYSADFWKDMESTLLGLLDEGPGRQVVANPQSGLLVVRATPREHGIVEAFLDSAQGSLQKQVVIEAKVVEVTLNNEFRSGINWNTFAGDLDQATNTVEGSLGANALNGIANIGGVFGLTVQGNDFASMLQLLSHQGDVQVLSSPRVSTVNNQKAVIKVGTDEFFVTEVNSGGGGDDNDGNSTPQFELTPFFSGIALDVTPQISQDDTVILHVRPSVTEVEERTKVINAGGDTYDLPLARSSIRETDSIIRARSGQIVVIGGLLSQQQDSSDTGLPWLSQVPGLSYLFSQKRDSQSKSELVILLKPRVYGEGTTAEDLDRVLNRM